MSFPLFMFLCFYIHYCLSRWKNCPKAWQGSYKGNKGTAVVLEAVCSHDLWIWHYHFGVPGACNDVNVLQRSHLLDPFINGTAPRVEYCLNGKRCCRPYWFTDGIYPDFICFLKSVADPVGEKLCHYCAVQEACRKDIERCFGVLHARFHIVKNPARSWTQEKLDNIMAACIIIHNMVVEEERGDYSLLSNVNFMNRTACPITIERVDPTDVNEDFYFNTINNLNQLQDREQHLALRNDLIEHLWTLKGNS